MPEKDSLKYAFARSQKLDEQRKLEDAKLYPSPPGIPLTAGEVALVKSIFGDEIDTKNVRKYFPEKMKPGTIKGYVTPAQTFGIDAIKFYGTKYQSEDYSQSKDLYLYGTFLHEMTHIWQNQHPAPRAYSYTYQYTLTPRSRFDGFSEEQQSSIIEDYARQFFYLKQSLNTKGIDTYIPSCASDFNESSLRSLSLLRKVVEDKFPQARKTRLALEAKTNNSPKKSMAPPKAA